MKKLVLMLMFALSVSLTSCSWFDSAPVEPKILGITHVIEDRGLIYVEIDSLRYPVTEVYTGKTHPRIGGFETVEPVDGMLVTVADFSGKGSYKGMCFMLGAWNEVQIEQAFQRNYTFGVVFGTLALLCFGIWFVVMAIEDNKRSKAT